MPVCLAEGFGRDIRRKISKIAHGNAKNEGVTSHIKVTPPKKEVYREISSNKGTRFCTFTSHFVLTL